MLDATMPKPETPMSPAVSDSLRAKMRADAGDIFLKPARDRILERAAGHLDTAPLSVTYKKILAPSGDPHDYMSMSPYHWPDPETADGLPYVRRDGEINPEARRTDLGQFRKLAAAVPDLAWAYFLSNDERFASKAIELIRVWFLDPATGMNPHLRYGGHIPGVVDGRSFGLTDTKAMCFILDAASILRHSSNWTEADDSGLREWVAAYLDWILTSEFGQKECGARNNHGTWHDAQVVACALFAGREDAIRKVHKSIEARIANQFTPEGAQPAELKRACPLQYCMMNLQGFFETASMLSKGGFDVWHFETPDGKSLKQATEWLAPYAVGLKRLPKADIVAPTPHSYLSIFRRAAIVWRDWRFEVVIHLIDPTGSRTDMLQFQYPIELEFTEGQVTPVSDCHR